MPKNETFEQRLGGGEERSHDNIGRKNISGKKIRSPKSLRWEPGSLLRRRTQCSTTKMMFKNSISFLLSRNLLSFNSYSESFLSSPPSISLPESFQWLSFTLTKLKRRVCLQEACMQTLLRREVRHKTKQNKNQKLHLQLNSSIHHFTTFIFSESHGCTM